MKQLLIDTNIIIDLLGEREPFYKDAARLFSLADRGEVKLLVSALSFANTNYVLTRMLDSEKAREILSKFKVLVRVADLTEKIVELSLSDRAFSDFEDGLQYYTAIENEASIIITRNLKDFKESKIPVMTAGEFLGQ